ncbi:hypothetical protein NC651_024308 [Populus alba x Populus x berolinensis]|nr:hypothetical protein NC651_024308 [Populus alba x Populus x berolinensis]
MVEPLTDALGFSRGNLFSWSSFGCKGISIMGSKL